MVCTFRDGQWHRSRELAVHGFNERELRSMVEDSDGQIFSFPGSPGYKLFDFVTEEEFRNFVDQQVTPRFPDGLTVLKGDGQFRGEDDITIKEQSFVLILLYPQDTFSKSSRKIERIRDLYKEAFDQESVLRVDDPFIVWVSF